MAKSRGKLKRDCLKLLQKLYVTCKDHVPIHDNDINDRQKEI